MTKEEKHLLSIDIAARLPYGIWFQSYHSEGGIEGKGTFNYYVDANSEDAAGAIQKNDQNQQGNEHNRQTDQCHRQNLGAVEFLRAAQNLIRQNDGRAIHEDSLLECYIHIYYTLFPQKRQVLFAIISSQNTVFSRQPQFGVLHKYGACPFITYSKILL